MIHYVLATDYDGTLAHEGQVDPSTIDALKRLRDSGRKLILVTGRRLENLLEVLREVRLFDRVVAENGALVYCPETGEEKSLGDPPPVELLDALRARGVDPVDVGRVIVATWSPHEVAALEAIRQLGLEWQIIFNKGAVMLLPSGVNKAVGLQAALDELGFSPRNVTAVGDAENDSSLLGLCGTSAAVANALPAVKSMADIVLGGERGAGVVELIDRLLDNDLADVACRPDRGIQYGIDLAGNPLFVPAFGESLLVLGGPGGGKSQFVTSFWERATAGGYQTCVIDPEGDYQASEAAIVVGTKDEPPHREEVLQVIEKPAVDCVVSMFKLDKAERPKFFDRLLRALLEHRSRTGRPHWIVVDEAHYAVPAAWQPAEELSAEQLHGTIFVSAFPDRVSETVFRAANLVVAIGDAPRDTLRAGLARLGQPASDIAPPEDGEEHGALAWHRADGTPIWFRRIPPQDASLRHQHHYLDGELEEEYRFYFRGPDSGVNLPAQNLRTFMQLAEGIDNATWEHHLRRQDYSKWLREVIKDEKLATEVAEVEGTADMPSARSRELIVEKIRERYENET